MTTSTTQLWNEWEDYQAGLYRSQGAIRPEKFVASLSLLSDGEQFSEVAREMIREWPVAAAHNLALPSGKRAWIGQAACCYAHGATGDETRYAWGRLSNQVQIAANRVADTVADEYARGWPRAQTLFDS